MGNKTAAKCFKADILERLKGNGKVVKTRFYKVSPYEKRRFAKPGAEIWKYTSTAPCGQVMTETDWNDCNEEYKRNFIDFL